MALKPRPTVAVGDDEAVQIDIAPEGDTGGGSNTASLKYGQTVVMATDGPLHFGGDGNVTNTGANRGALLPAGTWTIDLKGNDHIWVIAPAGETVEVEVLQVGV